MIVVKGRLQNTFYENHMTDMYTLTLQYYIYIYYIYIFYVV